MKQNYVVMYSCVYRPLIIQEAKPAYTDPKGITACHISDRPMEKNHYRSHNLPI